MLKDYWGDIPATPEAREWVRSIMDRAIWTVKEVQALYGLSQSTVSRLYTKHDWGFAFKKGNQILFLADYAKPWFDQYQAEQDINRSPERVDPETGKVKKKPGRVKKVKGEFEYELFGVLYKGKDSILKAETQWRLWLRNQYPHYFQPNLNRDGWPVPYFELMNDLEGTLCPDYRVNVAPKIEEINRVFRQLEKVKK